MNLSWWCCKHFSVVYLLIVITVILPFSLSSSSAAGNEPTEEPEETYTATFASTSGTTTSATATTSENVYSSSTKTINSNEDEIKDDTNTKGNLSERLDDDQLEGRALFRSSGNVLKSASKVLSRGLRMFRESLLEGAKVAHMFKEDLDEGMSTIMRQNRGVKVEGLQQHDDNSNSAGSGSIFDSQMLREGVLGGILRFMGINSKQMGVIALNCLIILAEWITSSMVGNNEVAGATSRMIKTNLLQWASTGHNSQIEHLLTQARSHSLPERIIESLSEKTGNSTSCVQLLICKMTPVIWGFQDTVKDQLNYSDQRPDIKTAYKAGNGSDTKSTQESWGEPRGFLASSQYLLDKFMGHLPETERMVDFGDRCESKFPHCQLLKFNSLTVKY